jgi:outer membrane immunogenic protein
VEVGDADDDSFAFGWNVGAGVEHKFDQNWSARLEYIYFSIEEDDLSVESPPNTLGFETDIDGHIVRAGVAYHF